jgi:hypothetical protein
VEKHESQPVTIPLVSLARNEGESRGLSNGHLQLY